MSSLASGKIIERHVNNNNIKFAIQRFQTTNEATNKQKQRKTSVKQQTMTMMKMITMILSQILVVAVAALVVVVESREFRVTWTIPSRFGPVREANVGDNILFNWSTPTDNLKVQLFPSGTCEDETGAEYIGGSSPVSFLVAEKHAGKTLFFTSDIGDQCEDGLTATFTVPESAPTEAPPPTNNPPVEVLGAATPGVGGSTWTTTVLCATAAGFFGLAMFL